MPEPCRVPSKQQQHKISKYVRHMCAKLVLNRSKYSSATDALKTLHWLPIRLRIKFKLVCIVHRCLYGLVPRYLKDKLTIKPTPSQTLRSNKGSDMILEVPRLKRKTFAARAFSVAGPSLWNSIPTSLRFTTNLLTFKKHLKTLLMSEY